MPTKLRYHLITVFCLMSLLPLLAGVYIASLFIKFPFNADAAHLGTASVVLVFSLVLSLLGFRVTMRLVSPIRRAADMAKKIAQGKPNGAVDVKGIEEIEELSKSLKVISENARELIAKVEQLSQKDKLTGLYNVFYIRERLQEEIQRAIHFQRPCSFAYLAIERFEDYAAVFGEEAGENLLKRVAALLQAELAQFDRAARINKNEFAIIFPDKNKKQAIECAERIREVLMHSLEDEVAHSGILLALSTGISENPLDGASGQELFSKAKERSCRVKEKGGNYVEAFA